MIYKEFTDFDNLYHDFTRLTINGLDEFKDDSFIVGATVYLNNVILKATSCDCHLDMADFNYTKAKWTILVNKYIDCGDYIKLKDRLANSTAKTLTFNFKIHVGMSTDKDQTKNRDSCIVALVFSRNGNSGKWTTVNIYYRVAEVYKKMAIDLILLNRMFNDLPNLDLHEFLFHIPQPFYSTFILSELMGNLFDISEFDKPDNFICYKINKFYDKYYGPDAVPSNYHAIARKQEMKKSGKKLPSIPIETLEIYPGPHEEGLW